MKHMITSRAHIGIDARLPYYRTGGISTYVRRLIKALESLDHQHRYSIFHRHHAPETLTQRFERHDLWTPAHHRFERLTLSLEVAWRRLDLWHSPDFIPPYYAAKRHLITVHDLTFLHYPQYLTADSRRYYNDQIVSAVQRADHLLADSESTKRDLVAMLHVPAAKITVHRLGVDEQFQPLAPDLIAPTLVRHALPNTGYILHVGTVEPRKNIPALLRAYRTLLADLPSAPPIVLAGRRGWFYDDLRAECDAIGLGERVLWRETLTDAELPALYNGALCLVSPSFYEGFGLPALEAMACGIVPIVSDRSSLPEITGDVGLLINPEEDASLANALYRTLSDPAWRAEQAPLARQRAALFRWEDCARTVLETYNLLLKSL